MDNRKIIFYDGECVLCNGFCAFLLHRLDQHSLYFASLHRSEAYQEMTLELEEGIDSVVFVDGDQIYTHSDAVIQIFKHIDGPWKVVALLGFIPLSIRDRLYRIVARYRKRFLGTARSCKLYSKEQRERLLA